MQVRDHTLLWAAVSVDIVDVDKGRLNPGEELDYCAPTDLFLVSGSGMAWIEAGNLICSPKAAPVIHIRKGARLYIYRVLHAMEYFLIRIHASLPHVLPAGLTDPQGAVQHFYSCYRSSYRGASMYRKVAFDMYMLWHQKQPLSQLEAKQRLYTFVHLLLTELERLERVGEKVDKQDVMAAALSYMEVCYHESLVLSALAERLQTNQRCLQRIFKMRLGYSPIEYLIRIRIEHAKQLLEQGNQSLAQIAEEVGYPDIYYFSRLFKKKTGFTPRTYKR